MTKPAWWPTEEDKARADAAHDEAIARRTKATPTVTAENSDGEVEQHDGTWHLAECDILKSNGVEYSAGDAPCNCDTDAAAVLAADQRMTWTESLAKLAQFASDHELPRPITLSLADDDFISVAVSGPDHAAWFEHFKRAHVPTTYSGGVLHYSWGELPSGVHVSLSCLSDAGLPSTVAVR